MTTSLSNLDVTFSCEYVVLGAIDANEESGMSLTDDAPTDDENLHINIT
jgi:hypothetical protein